MNSNEFSPLAYFNHVMSHWWLVTLAVILGGTFGFVFHQLHPPVFEATATYFVTIDMDLFPLQSVREDLIQYNEDMAVGTTEGALLSKEVVDELITQLKDQGIILSTNELLKYKTIERKHDIWELRFRDGNPQKAQAIITTWAFIGYQEMLAWQTAGKTPNYVIFQPPTVAEAPQEPVLYDRNRLMLAGALIGLIIGTLGSGMWANRSVRSSR